MAIVDLADTFTRSDTSQGLGPLTTGGKSWRVDAGVCRVESQRARFSGGLASVDVEVADYVVAATLWPGAHIRFRAESVGDYWRVRHESREVVTGTSSVYGTEYEWRSSYGGLVTGGHHPSGGATHTTVVRTGWSTDPDVNPTPVEVTSLNHDHGSGGALHALPRITTGRTGVTRQTVVGTTTTTRTDVYLHLERVVGGTVTLLASSPRSAVGRVEVETRADGSVAVTSEGLTVFTTSSATLAGSTRAGLGGDGVADSFTVTPLTRPPNAPTALFPNGGDPLNTTVTQLFSWRHGSLMEQTRAALRYRQQGSSAWVVLDNLQSDTHRMLPAHALAVGVSYEWQVQTYSGAFQSPWSELAFFTTAAAPAAPVITVPADGATVGTSSLTAMWTSVDSFDAFQVRSTTGAGGAVTQYDSGTVVGSVGSHVVPFPVSGRTETVWVRVRRSGLWSAWDVAEVTVQYNPPPAPDHTVNPSGAWLAVTVVNGTPGASEAPIARNEIYRRRAGSTDPGGVRVAKDVPRDGLWLDPHVAHREAVEYSVVALSTLGTSRRGPWEPIVVPVVPVPEDDGTTDLWATGPDAWAEGPSEWTTYSVTVTDAVGLLDATDRPVLADAVGLADAATTTATYSSTIADAVGLLDATTQV